MEHFFPTPLYTIEMIPDDAIGLPWSSVTAMRTMLKKWTYLVNIPSSFATNARHIYNCETRLNLCRDQTALYSVATKHMFGELLTEWSRVYAKLILKSWKYAFNQMANITTGIQNYYKKDNPASYNGQLKTMFDHNDGKSLLRKLEAFLNWNNALSGSGSNSYKKKGVLWHGYHNNLWAEILKKVKFLDTTKNSVSFNPDANPITWFLTDADALKLFKTKVDKNHNERIGFNELVYWGLVAFKDSPINTDNIWAFKNLDTNWAALASPKTWNKLRKANGLDITDSSTSIVEADMKPLQFNRALIDGAKF